MNAQFESAPLMVDFALNQIPLWLAACVLVLLCMGGMELGRFVHARYVARAGEPVQGAGSEVSGYIISAIFGLLAFMVAMTFSIAVDRFESRRGWVADEAIAIEVAYQRADLLPEPERTGLQSALRDYAESRIAPRGGWTDASSYQLERSHQLLGNVWSNARQAFARVKQIDLGTSIVEAVNEVTTSGARRELAGATNIPSRIINALLLYLLVASGVLGFLAGSGRRRHHIAAALLFALFATAFVIILDLDRPRSGAIEVSQRPVENLAAKLRRTAERPPPPFEKSPDAIRDYPDGAATSS